MGKWENSNGDNEALNLENTIWGSTVVEGGHIVGCAIYNGNDTRAKMNANKTRLKSGLIDEELNYYSKILCVMMVGLSLFLILFKQPLSVRHAYYFGRFMLLLSTIIPISLKVHMDISKIWYSLQINRDEKIKGTVAKTTTIPEDLGRIEYLFTDKTGTLTQNEMVFKKLVLRPPLQFSDDHIELIKSHMAKGFKKAHNVHDSISSSPMSTGSRRISQSSNISNNSRGSRAQSRGKTSGSQVWDIMESMAICHNVYPIMNDNGNIEYQAASPDEISLVKFTEKCGLKLISRTDDTLTLELILNNNDKYNITYQILKIFPFTSESKRMGIIVKNVLNNSIAFHAKGASEMMKSKMQPTEWLEEEIDNIARQGLRTLVFAKKELNEIEYNKFKDRYHKASIAMHNRKIEMDNVREHLEHDMIALGISGVEDKLQDNVQQTLETLRNANIKIWMLTGDKVETAKVIARSSKLVNYGQNMFPLIVKSKRDAIHKLDVFGGMRDTCLIVDGKSLDIIKKSGLNDRFVEYAVTAPTVICCRCAPQQKSEMVELVQDYSGKRTCAIGDGGNDVSMIQKSHVGIGIFGKEGQQAAAASDFSILKFEYIARLLLDHGRVAYKGTAKVAQFVLHRGLIIAVVQLIFSMIFYFSAIPIFTGLVAVGYTCVYTSLPVITLLLDRDVSAEAALYYPELYHSLQKGSSLNNKTFLSWVIRSFFQGSVIMWISMLLFETEFHNIMNITFTALILTELVNVILEVKKWHYLMVLSEIGSVLIYFGSILVPIYEVQSKFDTNFILSPEFWWKSAVVTAASTIPIAIAKVSLKWFNPSAHMKLKGVKTKNSYDEFNF